MTNKIIKITKYSHNRSMYDSTNKKATNLVDIAKQIKKGFDIDVNLDGEFDITTETLISILLNTGLDFKKESELKETLYYLIDDHLKL